MMTSLAQSYSPHPGGIQQHPGVPQGHPMAGVPHNQGQQVPGQPGMPQQMHMGVSGLEGPQVSQAGAMMGWDATWSWRAKCACSSTSESGTGSTSRKRKCISNKLCVSFMISCWDLPRIGLIFHITLTALSRAKAEC